MGKSSPSSNQSTTVNPPAFALPGLTQAAGEATRLYNEGPQQFFPGQTFADFNPLQTQGQQSQVDFANQVLPGLNQQIFGGFGQALNTDVTQDPSVQAALASIENRGNRNFAENIAPTLRRGGTGVGQEFGTRPELAVGVAGRDLAGQIADAQASFLAQQLGSARQAQGAGLALAPQIAQQGLMGGNILGQIGAQQQGQEQLGINEAMNRFNFEQGAPVDSLNQLIAQLTGATGGGSQSSQFSGTGGGINPAIGGAIGGGLLASQLPASILGSGAFGNIGSVFGPAGIAGGALLGALLS